MARRWEGAPGAADFMRSLFASPVGNHYGLGEPTVHANGVAIVSMDGDKLAKVELVTSGTRGVYTGVRISVVSTQHGVIDTAVMRFDEVLDIFDRADDRDDYIGGYSVRAHCGWKWYIATPTTPADFGFAVYNYISEWR